MATPSEKLAASLTALGKLQKGGRRVFQSKELSRLHRERLLRNGFLQEVMKGWLLSSSPAARPGDSTPWYASFWEFCARYCEARFGDQWHLSPEQSLLLHGENTIIPGQAVIHSPIGTNNKLDLLFGTSLYDLKVSRMLPPADLTVRERVRLLTPEAALVRASETFFNRHPIETRVALASVRDASEILRRLLDGGHSIVAGRLAGAFRVIGRPRLADEITSTMKSAGYDVWETNPFLRDLPVDPLPVAAPIAGRIRALWQSMRSKVLAHFPEPPGSPASGKAYLLLIDEIYRNDAYHSLSIEGYAVTPDLIERVRAGHWDPDNRGTDKQDRDALAARGYWQAFQAVRGDIKAILAGANPGIVVRDNHRTWYRELFQPCVTAGLIAAGALAGYRKEAVFLRASRYVPPRWEAVGDAMAALFELLEKEPDAGVRAVLGHWMFGYIHPYPDGNGRIARFLMNAMLAWGGYPWTLIRVEDRAEYLAALDTASIDLDIVPFARFVAKQVRRSLKLAR